MNKEETVSVNMNWTIEDAINDFMETIPAKGFFRWGKTPDEYFWLEYNASDGTVLSTKFTMHTKDRGKIDFAGAFGVALGIVRQQYRDYYGR